MCFCTCKLMACFAFFVPAKALLTAVDMLAALTHMDACRRWAICCG